MAFVVNSISAKSDYLVTTSSGTVILPVTAQIWTLLSPRPATWYVDGTGSKEPRIFSIPRTAAESYDVPIQLEGFFTFPSSWTGQYVVQAYPNGLSIPILESHRHVIPPPTNPPIPVPIKIDSFKASSPFKDFVCPIPFRWAGDFEWKIRNVNVEANVVRSALPTRLELCWAHAQATSGPLFVHSEFLDTRVDFASSYPIGLIRQFWPWPSEFQEVHDFNFVEVSAPWYVKRAMDSIWSWGTPHQLGKPRFDCKGGAASYNVNALGGYFDLQRWLADCSPCGTCNSYDLAAISQLACALLLDAEGNELVRSKWVLQAPTGFILPGTLYGRETIPNCNNPFFQARGSSPFIDPQLDPLSFKVNRSFFANHAWVEFNFPTAGTRRVLDATHGISANPETGARSRQQYSSTHIDPTWNSRSQPTAALFGNLMNNGVAEPNGNCYQTPEYHPTDSRRIDRIGIRGIKGALTMPVLSTSLDLPRPMRTSIEAALALSLNPKLPRIGHHNASLDQATLSTVFAGSDGIRHLQTFHSIARHHTRISHDFMQVTSPGFTVDITTHVNYEDPLESMVHHLASFEAPLADIVSAPLSFLGSHSLQSLSSFFWVRGNLFISLSYAIPDELLLSGREEDLRQRRSQCLDLALRLDQYLADNTVDPPLVAVPDTTLTKEADMPEQATVGMAFKVRLANPQTSAVEAYCESDDCNVIVANGVMAEGGTFNFYPVRKGITALTLFLAHKSTLYPASCDFIVKTVD